jgi:endonuclease/exonuclease/phosphatase family metal-dependent hydrolase
VFWGSWLYLALVLVAWAVLALTADRWWLGTLLLFGPRWVLAVPLLVLLPAAAVRRRALLASLSVAAVLLAGPVTGFCLPTARLSHPRPLASLRILTCNTDGLDLRPGAFRQLLMETGPDIVALQEWQPEFEAEVFAGGDWHIHHAGGPCLASRYPVGRTQAVRDKMGWRDIIVRHDLKMPGGTLYFYNAHLATPRSGLQEVVDRGWAGEPEMRANAALRFGESEAAAALVAQTDGGAVLVAGDFNLPCESTIYRQYWGGFADAFPAAGFGWGHTKFTRWWGVRIDHILAGPGWHCRRCWVGPDVGSDHRPVIADMDWLGLEE